MVHDSRGQLIPQDWTLGIELIGSALIPFLVAITRQPLHWLWLTLLGIAFFFLVPQNEYFSSGSYYVSFILGVLLARHYVWVNSGLKQLKFRYRLIVLFVGSICYQARRIADHFGYNGWKIDGYAWVICSIGCALIIISSLSSSRIGSFLNTKPVLFIGRISYSVYLLHFIILLCVLPLLVLGLNRLGFGPSPWMLPFTLAIGLFLTLAIAIPFYKYVEVPSVDLGHFFSSKLKKRINWTI
jgi:peptidoglycan/LPS O-acetylase OafA/YrhL